MYKKSRLIAKLKGRYLREVQMLNIVLIKAYKCKEGECNRHLVGNWQRYVKDKISFKDIPFKPRTCIKHMVGHSQ